MTLGVARSHTSDIEHHESCVVLIVGHAEILLETNDLGTRNVVPIPDF